MLRLAFEVPSSTTGLVVAPVARCGIPRGVDALAARTTVAIIVVVTSRQTFARLMVSECDSRAQGISRASFRRYGPGAECAWAAVW